MVRQSRSQQQTDSKSKFESQTNWSRHFQFEHHGTNDWVPYRSGTLISLSRSESFLKIYNLGSFIVGIRLLCFGIIFDISLVAGSFFILFWEYNIING